MTLSTKKVLTSTRDYVMIIVGLACYAFGFTAFILPEKVVTGGIIGLASVTHFAFGWDVAVVNYGINVVLLALAYRTVGRQFVLRTVFGATAVFFILRAMLAVFTEPLVEQQPFMNVIIGSTLCGVGLGITFTHNGSSGGTDIIAAVVAKYSNVPFGRMMLYCDLVIIGSSYFLFHGVDKIVYGVVFMFINAFVADMVINNNRQAVQFLIFSENWEDIANAINNDAHRGCTLLHGTGWYTKRDVKILLVMCRRYESQHIFRIIKAVDPNAFISQSNVNGVYGSGFDTMKVRMNKYKPHITDENMPAALIEATAMNNDKPADQA